MIINNDDEDITSLFKTFLQYNGYVIDPYTDSVEPFNNFRKDSHDLIILDINDRRA